MHLAEIYGTDLDGLLYGNEKQQKAVRRIKVTAGITLGLFSLLPLVGSILLWCNHRFFPLAEGQVSPEEMAVLETHMRLDRIWTCTDSILLIGSTLAFLLLLIFLVRAPGIIPQKQKFLYAGALTAALLVLPLPFAFTDPVFPPVNYLITPILVIGWLAVFLVLDLVIEALIKKKKRN
jgi:hypothetical protein